MFDPAIPARIMHQTQSNNFDCLATCVAMVSGVTQYDIQGEMELLGLDIHESLTPIQLRKLLARHNILTESGPSNFTADLFNHIYIETVPYIGCNSIVSSAHSIVVDRRAGSVKVYDPYKEKPNKYYYVTELTGDPFEIKYDKDITYSRFLLIDCNVM